jgi:hypothetical protein
VPTRLQQLVLSGGISSWRHKRDSEPVHPSSRSVQGICGRGARRWRNVPPRVRWGPGCCGQRSLRVCGEHIVVRCCWAARQHVVN